MDSQETISQIQLIIRQAFMAQTWGWSKGDTWFKYEERFLEVLCTLKTLPDNQAGNYEVKIWVNREYPLSGGRASILVFHVETTTPNLSSWSGNGLSELVVYDHQISRVLAFRQGAWITRLASIAEAFREIDKLKRDDDPFSDIDDLDIFTKVLNAPPTYNKPESQR